jgi:hypothetical protein
MKTWLAVCPLVILACFVMVSGQTSEATWDSPEFGDIRELSGKSKVYVYCEDLKIRQVIVDELKKSPRLMIVGSVDEAEMVVNFTYRYVTTYSTGIISSTKTNIHSGDLIVSIAGHTDQNHRVHQRIVWSTQNERKTTFGKNPAQKGAQKFVEALRRVPDTVRQREPTPVIQPEANTTTASHVPSEDLLGTWNIVVTNERGVSIKEFEMTLSRAGTKLAAVLSSTDGTARVDQITNDGRTFSLVASEQNGSNSLTIALTGVVIGKTMKGAITMNNGEQVIPVVFTGSRAN